MSVDRPAVHCKMWLAEAKTALRHATKAFGHKDSTPDGETYPKKLWQAMEALREAIKL